MRGITAQVAAVLALNNRSEHLRVEVKDSGGTWRDLSSAPGYNAVDSCSIAESIDGQHRTLDLTLRRETFDFSVAGLRTDALGNNLTGSYSPLVELTREIRVSLAVCADGCLPVASDWLLVFHGVIDEVEDGAGDTATVGARDLGGALQETFIETERIYAFSNIPNGARKWKSGETYVLNELMLPTEGKQNGHYYKVTTAGTCAAAEPTWPTGSGSTVTSGTCTFTEQGASFGTGQSAETVMQQLLDDNALSSVTLYTPTSPGWTLKPWINQRQPLLEALRAIAGTIGWDCRYQWNGDTDAFELTFAAPDRAKTTPDITIGPSQYESIGSFKRECYDIRNVVRVVYSDSADLDPNGDAKRKTITVTDATSVTKYGRRFCEIAEDWASQIDTSTEATLLATNALADMKEPIVSVAASCYLLPHIELGDLVRFTGNNIHATGDQDLAVVSFRHELTAQGDGSYTARTAIECRGKPSVANRRWLSVLSGDARYGGLVAVDNQHRLQDLGTTEKLEIFATATVGGATITRVGTSSKEGVSTGGELHVSRTPGFTPDETTLVSRADGSSYELAQLIPGETYYAKLIPTGTNAGRIVRGEPTDEISFVAGRASPGHLNTLFSYDRPLNGDFEAYTAGTSALPDHWAMAVGSASNIERYTTSSHSGSGALRIKPAGSAQGIISDLFAAGELEDFRASLWFKVLAAGSGTEELIIYLRFFQADGVTATGSTGAIVANLGSTTGWTFGAVSGTAPANTRYCSVEVRTNGAAYSGTQDVAIDGVSFMERRITQDDVTYVSIFTNSWVNFGGSYGNAGYWKDSVGVVHLTGMIKSGTIGAAAFTLPTGYRPATDAAFSASSNSLFALVNVLSTGVVRPDVGSNVSFSLEGITFRAA